MDTKVEEVDDPNPDRLRLAMASQKLQQTTFFKRESPVCEGSNTVGSPEFLDGCV